MVTTVTTRKPGTRPERTKSTTRPDGSGGNDDDGSGGAREPSPETYRLGMWSALAAILMLFVALTSAYIVRQGLSSDWQPIALPPVLWLNTVLLIVSSLTIEAARRSLKRLRIRMFNRWLSVTVMLGVAFLVGQVVAWQQLAAQGIYLSTNPHSSFFYLLTGAHGVHLLGGVMALMYITFRFRISGLVRPLFEGFGKAFRVQPLGWQAKAWTLNSAIDLTALYWHFMDGLWVYLVILLFLWR